MLFLCFSFVVKMSYKSLSFLFFFFLFLFFYVMLVYLFFFFFSSRRRHTRFSRDWSSDVCSSDLGDVKYHLGAEGVRNTAAGKIGVTLAANPSHLEAVDPVVEGRTRAEQTERSRSEERRVGKECRSRGWAEERKKKKPEKKARNDA